MPRIVLKTIINAPIERCFDLSRSVDLHEISTAQTNEKAIDGVISGLIGVGESVTWKAKHFGIYHTLTSEITQLNSPVFFQDEMTKGIFKRFVHEHHFRKVSIARTEIVDVFEFESPLWALGKIADKYFVRKHMLGLLVRRSEVIKFYAETEKWRKILGKPTKSKEKK